ncbi:MAG: bifunctional (p)ppGpp synthetase/guanosine-3',5'-bis(diphosphate) 3'-pyrophosphohydrolase [Clostridia bacterium]|nr:bifunctional (p)ppGpp synthetase/guanosine-3',5'-bis(diphosphate) 3'-pyrophosphohydrolase [Clostridia bacterium]
MVNSFTELKEKIINKHPDYNIEIIEKAYNFASKFHEGQIRKSGEPYIIHPLSVAEILVELGLDEITITAALLHDIVEDTDVTLGEIKAIFGDEVASLVDGVTKLSRIEYVSKEERQVENYRKMFLAMANDIRVVIIKLADRLHNMRTLKYQSFWKQRETAKETLEIYAPLAHRLGISKVKWELEDLCLRYLYPDKYYNLVEQIQMKREERIEYINELITVLSDELEQADIKVDISGRPKHFYSIYKKMEDKGKELSEIYDLIAVRIICDSVRDCYGILGIIHTLWKPIPGRFKDYIAMPKPNMYQSLHTTVIGKTGVPIEIQIRTWDMHFTAEYGIAAHWLYKEKNKNQEGKSHELAWLENIKEMQNEFQDSKEFVETVKIDLFSDRVFVFSPKGDVFELPRGSNPIDFAYLVHTDVGHRCIGAKINGKIVPIDYKLKTGDIIEVMTSKQAHGPSRDWLNIVQTSQAKNRIRQWFKREMREENLEKGREIYEKEVKKQELGTEKYLKASVLDSVVDKLGFKNVEDMFVGVGEGVISANQIILKLKTIIKEPGKTPKEVSIEELKSEIKSGKSTKGGKTAKGIRVKDIDGVVIRFGKCCNPLPGDSVVGYITRGRGVSIHRSDCVNVKEYETNEPERLVEAAWDAEIKSVYQVEIEIIALDRPKITAEIMTTVNDQKVHISNINGRSKEGRSIVTLTVDINSLDQLYKVMDKIKIIKDVIEVRRVQTS